MPELVSEVFLDSSSGEPLTPDAARAWQHAYASGWGDPARLHRSGRRAAQALDQARQVVAETVGARPDEVVFTGSASLATYAAVAGLARGRQRVGRRVVTSTVEHSLVLATAAAVGEHITVPVDSAGHVDLDAWATAMAAPGTAMAALQVVNHEVGTRQRWEAAAAACGRAGVPLLLDATAALGRFDLATPAGWSVLVGGAGAFGGPPGAGVLVARRTARWRSPWPADDYQGGRWPGPPDVPAAYATAAALQGWAAERAEVTARQFDLVDQLRAGIAATVPDVDLAGDAVLRAPHLLTFSALYVPGEALTVELDRAGFAVASGSACSASSEHPSHVLAAMGALTHGNVRIGLTRATTAEEVHRFLRVLPPIVAELRARAGIETKDT